MNKLLFKISLLLYLISLCATNPSFPAMDWDLAAKTGSIGELLQLIKTEPQNINQSDDYGWTPLHFAVRTGNEEAVLILLKNGAKVSNTNLRGSSPLHFAASLGFNRIIKALLNANELQMIQ